MKTILGPRSLTSHRATSRWTVLTFAVLTMLSVAAATAGPAAAQCEITPSVDACSNGCPGHVVYVVNKGGGESVEVKVQKIAMEPGKSRDKSTIEHDLDAGERGKLGCSTQKSVVKQCVVAVRYKVKRCS